MGGPFRDGQGGLILLQNAVIPTSLQLNLELLALRYGFQDL